MEGLFFGILRYLNNALLYQHISALVRCFDSSFLRCESFLVDLIFGFRFFVIINTVF